MAEIESMKISIEKIIELSTFVHVGTERDNYFPSIRSRTLSSRKIRSRDD